MEAAGPHLARLAAHLPPHQPRRRHQHPRRPGRHHRTQTRPSHARRPLPLAQPMRPPTSVRSPKKTAGEGDERDFREEDRRAILGVFSVFRSDLVDITQPNHDLMPANASYSGSKRPPVDYKKKGMRVDSTSPGHWRRWPARRRADAGRWK